MSRMEIFWRKMSVANPLGKYPEGKYPRGFIFWKICCGKYPGTYIGILRVGRGWVNYLHLKEVGGGRVVWVPPSEGVGYLQVVQFFEFKISHKGKNLAKKIFLLNKKTSKNFCALRARKIFESLVLGSSRYHLLRGQGRLPTGTSVWGGRVISIFAFRGRGTQ